MNTQTLARMLALSSLLGLAWPAQADTFVFRLSAPSACPTAGCPPLGTKPSGQPGNGSGNGGGSTEPSTPTDPPPTPPALPGKAVLSTSSLSFGGVEVGSSGPVQFVTLTNTGGQALPLAISTVSGASDFGMDNGCGASLAPSNSCTINVMFTPAGAGAREGAVGISAGSDLLAVSVSGVGLQAIPVLTGEASFGALEVGHTATRTLTYQNQGNTPLRSVSVSVTGSAFTLKSTDCAKLVAEGSSCSAVVEFAPTATQAFDGVLSVVANNGATQQQSLTGSGVAPVVALTGSGDFGTVTVPSTATRTFTYRNDGQVAATGVYAVLPTDSTLSLTSNSCGTSAAPQSIAPGAACTVVLKYTPTTGSTLTGASLAISATNAPTRTVALTGTATAANLEMTAAATSFGEVPSPLTSTLTFSYKNTGTAPASSLSASVSGTGLSLVSNTCGTGSGTLAVNASCSVQVRYAPAKMSGPLLAGTVAASLSVTHSVTSNVNRTTLTGSSTTVDYSSLMSGYARDTVAISKHSAWNGTLGTTFYWSVANAQSSAPAGTLTVQRVVTVSGSSAITAYVQGTVDDVLTAISVNGSASSQGSGWAYQTVTASPSFTLYPGKNVVSITVVNNQVGPAGFLMLVKDSSGAVLAPASGWMMQ